jgi:hypothetical protein
MRQLAGLLGSTRGSRTRGMLPLALSVLLVSVGYYAGGVIGAVRGYPPSGIASIWLPTAILLGALLLTPPHHWWLYLLGVIPAHLHLVATFQRPEVPLLVMLIQVGTNAGLAVLAAAAVRSVIGAPPRLDSLRNLAIFIVLAGVAATAVVCAVAVWLFQVVGWATDFWLSWRQRGLGHVFPMITIGFCRSLLVRHRQSRQPKSPSSIKIIAIGQEHLSGSRIESSTPSVRATRQHPRAVGDPTRTRAGDRLTRLATGGGPSPAARTGSRPACACPSWQAEQARQVEGTPA